MCADMVLEGSGARRLCQQPSEFLERELIDIVERNLKTKCFSKTGRRKRLSMV